MVEETTLGSLLKDSLEKKEDFDLDKAQKVIDKKTKGTGNYEKNNCSNYD